MVIEGVRGVEVDALEVHVRWFVDDEEVATSQELAAGSALYAQSVHAMVRISNGIGFSDQVRSDTLSIGNSEPTVESVTLSPTEVYTNDTVTVSYTTSDPDNQELTLVAYDWSIDGEWILTSADPSLDGTSYFGRGDQVAVAVTVTDGVTEAQAESEALEVSDTPGEAPEAFIESEQMRPSEDIVCEVLSPPSDIDTDVEPTYAFQWTVDGKPHTGELLATLYEGDTVPSTATASEQIWTCELIATLDEAELTATATTEIVDLRPDEAPDWRIFFISGHCTDCDNLNEEYMDTDSSDTLTLIQSTMEAYGFTVEAFAYVDEFYNRDAHGDTYMEAAGLPGHGDPEPTGMGVPDRWGFIQIMADMEYIRDAWQADFVDPTRVMFVAHSHGDVWAHQAFRTIEDLDIELAVDLDGYSLYWATQAWPSDYGDDWQDEIQDYNQAYGTDLYDEASSSWYVDGLGLEDVEDVIPQDNITYCLEVQASEEWNLSAGWINDDDDNHRPDGSSTGVTTYYAASQSHSEVTDPAGEGVGWVLTQLDDLYGLSD